jgi:hypothetical protein
MNLKGKNQSFISDTYQDHSSTIYTPQWSGTPRLSCFVPDSRTNLVFSIKPSRLVKLQHLLFFLETFATRHKIITLRERYASSTVRTVHLPLQTVLNSSFDPVTLINSLPNQLTAVVNWPAPDAGKSSQVSTLCWKNIISTRMTW